MKIKSLLSVSFAVLIVFLTNGCQNSTGERTEVKNTGDKPVASIDYNEDLGGEPWVLDIEEATLGNENYRVTNWTGNNLQLVFMTLKPGEVIDLEMHEGHDQFIRFEQGEAHVMMGKEKDKLSFDRKVSDDWSILVPAGYWHKIENTGSSDLKVYTLYGPPEHAKGTLHKTHKEAAEAHHLETDTY